MRQSIIPLGVAASPRRGLRSASRRARQLLVLCAVLPAPLLGLDPFLVRDIHTGSAGSAPCVRHRIGEHLLVNAQTSETGYELWSLDDNGETRLVKDIRPGEGSSRIGRALPTSGGVVFAAEDGVHGRELWVSDGSSDGTRLLLDINPGPGSSDPQEGELFAGELYFAADDTDHGVELWRTDGSAAGTQRVEDLEPGPADSNPIDLTPFAGRLYFLAETGGGGAELWRTDGTQAGTEQVLDQSAGGPSVYPYTLTVFGEELFFHSYTEGNRGDLWAWSEAGGLRSIKTWDGAWATSSGGLVVAGTRVFFTVLVPGEGYYWWVSDGTTEGTRELQFLHPLQRPSEPMSVGDRAYLVINDEFSVRELWTSDGTPEGTRSLFAGPRGWLLRTPGDLIDFEGTLFFRAIDEHTGAELWTSDGTPEGTGLWADLAPGVDSGGPVCLSIHQGNLYFRADDGLNGPELWRSDGTVPGTAPVGDFNKEALGSEPSRLTRVGNLLFFLADDGTHGQELWAADGLGGEPYLVKDLTPGSASTFLVPSVGLGDLLLFWLDEQTWRSDGTGDGTWPISHSGSYVVAGDLAYYLHFDEEHGGELWATDGTIGGERLVADLIPGTESGWPQDLTAVGDLLYFRAFVDDDGRRQLWRTDGTAPGTFPLTDLKRQDDLTPVGDLLFFTAAREPGEGDELWVTDSTRAGTRLVKEIVPGIQGPFPWGLRAVGELLYFSADDKVWGNELWRSDGTEAGTYMVADVRPGEEGSSAFPIGSVGDRVAFTANDGVHGVELWASDGTEAGTALVRDFLVGENRSSAIRSATLEAQGLMFFMAWEPDHGIELWASDLRAGGTFLVDDIRPGSLSSQPSNLQLAAPVLAGSHLFFPANDGRVGRELWAIELETALEVADVRLEEGNLGLRPAVFDLRLTLPTASAVEVEYSTVPGTAVPGEDYIARSGVARFEPGVSNTSIAIDVVGDLRREPDEFFTLDLEGTANAVFFDIQATATILDDEPTPIPRCNPGQVVLTGQVLDQRQVFWACETLTASDSRLESSADVAFVAGRSVVLGDGIRVIGAGRLAITITEPDDE